ncbi:MAG TPA: histidine kinase [Gemmatimonas sp.]|uniref:sensor histidine kinase n=1 Tax=Gemmatimonas sp. TaxID=1962908 RepID=UPI002ED7D4CE
MMPFVGWLATLLQIDVQYTPPALLETELAATLLQGAVTTGVAVLCAHLYVRYRRSWFGWFAVAWGVYVARLFCILSFLLTGERVWLYWHQVTTGWTALALLWASLVFSRQMRPRAVYLGWALFPPLWSYIAIYQLDHFLWAALPAVLFLSGATAWTGWVFWRHHRIAHSTGARWLAVSFALWGLHHLDYPFLRAQGAWTPWGYYLDISFVLLVAAGLVLLVLDDLGRGVRALSALSGDLQRRASRGHERDPVDTLLVRPLALPGVRGAAMFLFDAVPPTGALRTLSKEPSESATDTATDSAMDSAPEGSPEEESAAEVMERVLSQARARGEATPPPDALARGRFVSGAGVCSAWAGDTAQHEVHDALARMRLTRRPQIVAAAGEQPFVAVLPVGAGSQLVGALVMAGDVRNPFTALDDDFLLALGQQVGAALDQWALDRQLAARTQALEQLSARMLRQHEEERRRLSRELHDETAQVFSAVKMQLESLRPLLAPDSSPRLDRLLSLVDTGIASIRQVTSALRPTLLDDLGLRPALHSLITDFTERSGLLVVFGAPPTLPPLPGDADLAVFRALQEALSNIVRHAGAQRVDVTVSVDDDALIMIVGDDGRGFPTLRDGRLRSTEHRMGITGMRERLLAVDGTVVIANRTPGAELTVTVPRLRRQA